MQIRHLDRTRLSHEYGLDSQRLVPWAELNAPFEGAWCVVRAGTASTRHNHHEHEIFIAISGEATVESDTDQRTLHPGDVVLFLPGVAHRVINDGDTDFEMYSIWWDQDLSHSFISRSRQAG